MGLNFRWNIFGLKTRRIVKIRRELDALLTRRHQRDALDEPPDAEPVLVAFPPGGRPQIYHFERGHRESQAARRNAGQANISAHARSTYAPPALEDLGAASALASNPNIHIHNAPEPASAEDHEQDRLPQNHPV
ncbi:hypothetical protein EA187_02855 [Lujinxingia sediminis]|uniref:Uncharacterized protein n=1 Tax=Lujinxingia sediminis TaxID=2480984 RepID=A0ABY0CWW2_9DELT|nr:hypothetical protein [Lujinxingia sediminis]RVU48392.1 hypothetical protein EA187_02855 [Lujinxingia sediminis]